MNTGAQARRGSPERRVGTKVHAGTHSQDRNLRQPNAADPRPATTGSAVPGKSTAGGPAVQVTCSRSNEATSPSREESRGCVWPYGHRRWGAQRCRDGEKFGSRGGIDRGSLQKQHEGGNRSCSAGQQLITGTKNGAQERRGSPERRIPRLDYKTSPGDHAGGSVVDGRVRRGLSQWDNPEVL